MENVVQERILSFRNFLRSVNLTAIVNDKEEFHFLSYRDANSYLLDSEVEAEVLAWTLRILEEGKCPGSLASALANAVLMRVKESDLRDVRRNNQNSEGATQQELEPIKLFTKVTHCIEDVLEEWQRVSDADLEDIAEQVEAVSVYAIKNGRRKMEDRHVVIQDLNQLFGIKSEPRTSFYAVFDGHAGTDAAVYSTVHLHCNIVNHPSYHHDLPTAIKESFNKTDLDFIAKSTREELKSGSTALACLLRGKQLHLAWLGDSQAILVRGGKPVYNMVPHKPDREDEKQRIENAGGCVVFFGTWRVNGTLAVSRAIGDTDYKPYVCSDADIETISLDGSEDFVVLGCDGLWDVLQADDIVELVYSYLAKQPGDASSVAAHLVQTAKERGSADNITVIVVFLRDISEWPVDEVIAHHANRAASAGTSETSNSHVDDQFSNGADAAMRAFNDFCSDQASPHSVSQLDSSISDALLGDSNVDFSGTAFSDAANAPNFSKEFASSWEDSPTHGVVPSDPVSASRLDSSAPEFVPGDKAAAATNNPFASESGLLDLQSSEMFSGPSDLSSSGADNPFLQSSNQADFVQGIATGGQLFGFDFAAGDGDGVDVLDRSPRSPWLSDVPTRPTDFAENTLVDHAALLKSTLSPDAEPFVMTGRHSGSPLTAGSEKSTPMSDDGSHDFMLPSLQPVQLFPTAPPAELTPRSEESDVVVGLVSTTNATSEVILSPHAGTYVDPLDQFSALTTEGYRPLSASPLQEDRHSLPTSPEQEENAFLATSPQPMSPSHEHQSSLPTTPLQENRPSLPISPLQEQRPSLPTSPLQEDRPSLPTSPLQEERPSLPTSPLQEERPSLPTSPLQENRPSLSASPLQEDRPSITSSPVQEDQPSLSQSPVQQERDFMAASPQPNELRPSPTPHHLDPFTDNLQLADDHNALLPQESAFDAFLSQRSDAAEALEDSALDNYEHLQHHAEEHDENALLNLDSQAAPQLQHDREEDTLFSPTQMPSESQWTIERSHSETQFTESLIKDDLHTVYTAGQSTVSVTSTERENSAGITLDFVADHQHFGDATFTSAAVQSVQVTEQMVEERMSVDLLERDTGFQSAVRDLAPAEVSGDCSGSGTLLDNISDSALVADDVEDAESEDDGEWRFYATNAAEAKPAEQPAPVDSSLLISAESANEVSVETAARSVETVDLIPKSEPVEVKPIPVTAAAAAPSKPVAAKRSDPSKTGAAGAKSTTTTTKPKSAPAATSRSAATSKTTATAAKPATTAATAAARVKTTTTTTTSTLASKPKPSEVAAKKTAGAPAATTRKVGDLALKVSGSAATSTAPPRSKPASASLAAKAPVKSTAPARSTSAPTAAATAATKKTTTTTTTSSIGARAPTAATRRVVPATSTTNGVKAKVAESGAAAPPRKPAPITKPAAPAKNDIKQTKETTNKQISGITKRTVTVTKTTTSTSTTSAATGSKTAATNGAARPAASKTASSRPTGNTANGTNGLLSKTTTTTTTSTARGVPPKPNKSMSANSTTLAYGIAARTTTTTAAATKSPVKSPVKSSSDASPQPKASRTSTPKSTTSSNKPASMLSNGRKASAAKTTPHSGSTQRVAVTRLKAAAVAAPNEEGEKGILDAVAKESVLPASHDNMSNGNNNDVRTADDTSPVHLEQYASNGADYQHSGSNGSCNVGNDQGEGDSFMA